MPQLDKYIFFNQIIYLTFFFSLIYIYIRGVVVPKISILLKYRKKRTHLFTDQINGYTKILRFCKSYWEKESKIFITYLVEKINFVNTFYKNNNLTNLSNIFNSLNTFLKTDKKTENSIVKNKIELKRLTTFSNN